MVVSLKEEEDDDEDSVVAVVDGSVISSNLHKSLRRPAKRIRSRFQTSQNKKKQRKKKYRKKNSHIRCLQRPKSSHWRPPNTLHSFFHQKLCSSFQHPSIHRLQVDSGGTDHVSKSTDSTWRCISTSHSFSLGFHTFFCLSFFSQT